MGCRSCPIGAVAVAPLCFSETAATLNVIPCSMLLSQYMGREIRVALYLLPACKSIPTRFHAEDSSHLQNLNRKPFYRRYRSFAPCRCDSLGYHGLHLHPHIQHHIFAILFKRIPVCFCRQQRLHLAFLPFHHRFFYLQFLQIKSFLP